MSFVNKLDNTLELLSKIDHAIMIKADYNALKKQLFIMSDDLLNYKAFDSKKIVSENHEIKSKIENVIQRINEIEQKVRNKLIITEKYSSHLNSS
tara:strand:- start:449 stop:733 length:285 start_codon:yes stop_codon:yes gene_type:complete